MFTTEIWSGATCELVTVRLIVLPDLVINPSVRAELQPVIAVGVIVGVRVIVGTGVIVDVPDGV